MLALGAEYLLSNRSRLYARYELISTLLGRYALYDNQSQNTTLIGIDTDYMRNGHFFSEYRIRDAISGREAEAAIGLRNLWNLGKGVRLHTTFERIHGLGGVSANPVLGASANESTAVTAALEYTRSARLKGTTRLELRRGNSTDSLLHTFGVAYKLGDDWTALARSIVSVSRGRGSGIGGGIEDRLQLGMAYRQTALDKWSALVKYEFRYDKDDAPTMVGQLFSLSLRRKVHLLSSDLNFQPSRRFIVSGHYAAKFVTDDSNGLSSNTSAQLLSTRLIYDWARRSDISLIASTLFGRSFSNREYGLGLELGYLLRHNLWLSAGYNLVGYRDPDFSEDNDTQRGPYLRLRYKFDEDLFGRRSSIAERLAAGAAATTKQPEVKPAVKPETKPEAKPEVTTTPPQPVEPKPAQPIVPTPPVDTPQPEPQPVTPVQPEPPVEAPQPVTPVQPVTPTPPVEEPPPPPVTPAPPVETPAPQPAMPVQPEAPAQPERLAPPAVPTQPTPPPGAPSVALPVFVPSASGVATGPSATKSAPLPSTGRAKAGRAKPATQAKSAKRAAKPKRKRTVRKAKRKSRRAVVRRYVK
ncbi:MAG: hypothetical protein M3347_14600 [Armatimonadota bacterium]|nr:hypothetical protein [Armatimonadota bacterium]